MSDTSETQPVTELKRRLTLPLLLLYGLGITVGAGIYVLIGLTAAEAGIFAPVSFLVAAFVVAFTALSYTELSTRFPVSAGEARYVREGFNSRTLSVLVGLLVILTALLSSATVSIGAASYLGQFIPLPGLVINIAIIIGLGLLAIWGIAESVMFAAVLTVIEIAGLLFVIGYAMYVYPDYLSEATTLLPSADLKIWSGIFGGALIAFFAFIGFEDIANVAEEVKNPSRNLPLAIVFTLVIALVLYLAVVSTVVLIVPNEELAQSSAPLKLVFKPEHSQAAGLLSVIAGLATLNGVLIQIIMASRVTYGMARQKSLPARFAAVNPVTGTPIFATVLIVGLILFFALVLPIERLAELTSQIVLIAFILVNLALTRLKLKTKSVDKEVFTVPIFVPLTGVISCGLLFISAFF